MLLLLWHCCCIEEIKGPVLLLLLGLRGSSSSPTSATFLTIDSSVNTPDGITTESFVQHISAVARRIEGDAHWTARGTAQLRNHRAAKDVARGASCIATAQHCADERNHPDQAVIGATHSLRTPHKGACKPVGSGLARSGGNRGRLLRGWTGWSRCRIGLAFS